MKKEFKVCPICKSPNRWQAKFCRHCAVEFAKICINGHYIPKDAEECLLCGERRASNWFSQARSMLGIGRTQLN